MAAFLLLLCAAALLVVAKSELTRASGDLAPIKLPVDVYVLTGLNVRPDGVSALSTAITADNIERAISAGNDIWRQAQIQWGLASLKEVDVGQFDIASAVEAALSANTRLAVIPDPHTARLLVALGDRLSAGREERFHIIVIPYLGLLLNGETLHGHDGKEYVFLSSWAEELSDVLRGPQPRTLDELRRRAPLVEFSQMNGNRTLSRTLAHELGHALGLQHETCDRDCLMGGTVSDGVRLSSYQIAKARSRAETPGVLDTTYDLAELFWLRLRWGAPRP